MRIGSFIKNSLWRNILDFYRKGRIENYSLFWRWENSPVASGYRKVSLQWISLRVKFRIYNIKWILWTMPEISMIMRQQAALGYPAVPSRLLFNCSEYFLKVLPRFLPAARYTEFVWYIWKRFWKSICTRWTANILFHKSVARCVTAAHDEFVLLNTGISVARILELERETINQHFAIFLLRFATAFFKFGTFFLM